MKSKNKSRIASERVLWESGLLSVTSGERYLKATDHRWYIDVSCLYRWGRSPFGFLVREGGAGGSAFTWLLLPSPPLGMER